LEQAEKGKITEKIFWKLGTRSKLRPNEEAYERIKQGKALGRAIWIPDAHEGVFSGHIAKKFLGNAVPV